MRLINADALKEKVNLMFGDNTHITESVCDLIDNAPTVEAYTLLQVKDLVELNQKLIDELEERPQGEWLFDKENSFTIDMFKCSICGYFGDTHFKFCPNCGADMRGAE